MKALFQYARCAFQGTENHTMRCLVLALLISVVLATGAGSAWALTAPVAHAPHASAQMLNPPPRTWHVIAGFTQAIPTGNGNTEMVNQFYPRRLTIYQGDSVTWTINAHDQAHTVSFGPDPLLRKLENPQNAASPRVINGQKVLVTNPAVFLPSAQRPLVQHDAGFDKTLLNCGMIGPIGTPLPQACTVTFPHLGTYAYDCLFHSGIPGNADMDGVIKVIARPRPVNHTWTVLAGTGTATDALNAFVPPRLTIAVGDRVTWKSGSEHFHTVSFGIDPLKTPFFVPVGKGPRGTILAFNPRVFFPILPKNNIYTGGVASSGIAGLTGNYANLPGQRFLKAPFTLTFAKPGVYTYYCLAHAPLMKGTITVVPATR
jgi:plastocyanin